MSAAAALAALRGVVADPVFAALKALVIETTGMAFYADKDEELARILWTRMEETGIARCAGYLGLLRDPVAGIAEMEALVAELTIGETYFFRHKEQFDALRSTVLDDVIERNQTIRRLRIWSAGCATGPEPYSLAILLKREFGARIAGWQVSIVATDINQKFLARAREGRYDDWAFRSVPDEIRHTCFDQVGRQWFIRPEYKRLVTFHYHNLITGPIPSPADNIAAFDIIVCRNVVIYFSAAAIQGLIPRFRDCLAEGGWLIMGHAEPSPDLFRNFRAVNLPGAVLYQKREPAPAAPVAPLPLPVRPAPVRGHVPRRRPPPAAPPQPAVPVPPTGAALERVRTLADGGDWDEAAKACDHLLAENALDAGLHFLRGLILEQMGALDESEKALRRAIYLDRQRVLPHYHLGLFLWRREDALGAARSFRNVLGLLERYPDDHAFGEGDGITAGQLREVVTVHLGLIGGV